MCIYSDVHVAKVSPRPLRISHKDETPDFGCVRITCFLDYVSSNEMARMIMRIGLWEKRTIGSCLMVLSQNLLGETEEIHDSFLFVVYLTTLSVTQVTDESERT
jgi:hypothetical protein